MGTDADYLIQHIHSWIQTWWVNYSIILEWSFGLMLIWVSIQILQFSTWKFTDCGRNTKLNIIYANSLCDIFMIYFWLRCDCNRSLIYLSMQSLTNQLKGHGIFRWMVKHAQSGELPLNYRATKLNFPIPNCLCDLLWVPTMASHLRTWNKWYCHSLYTFTS